MSLFVLLQFVPDLSQIDCIRKVCNTNVTNLMEVEENHQYENDLVLTPSRGTHPLSIITETFING